MSFFLTLSYLKLWKYRLIIYYNILADNNFASTKKITIKSAKKITKNRKYLISVYLLKFNGAQIKLNLKSKIFIKKNSDMGIFSQL